MSMRVMQAPGLGYVSSRGKSYASLWVVILLGLAYKVILDIGYANIITTARYSDELYVYAPSLLKEAISYVVTIMLLTIFYFDRKRGNPSRLVIYLYTVLIIIPLLTMYGLGDAASPFVFACVGCIVLLTLISRLPIPFRIARLGSVGIWIGFVTLICIGLFVYSNLLLGGGSGRLNFDLMNSALIYKVRSVYVASTSFFMGYLLFWQSDIVNTMLMLVAIRRRSKLLFVTALVLQAILFGMTNFKMMAFVPALVIFVYLFYKREGFVKVLLSATSAVLILSFALYTYGSDKTLVDLVSDRVFYFPAQLHVLYYDFFSTHEHVHLGNSVLSRLVANPYNLSMPAVIAQRFFGGAGSPNTGFMATAYAQFGFGGMFAFSVILGYLLAIYDRVTGVIPARYAAAAMAAPAMSFTNSAMFTTLLTGGFLLALLEMWLFVSLFHGGVFSMGRKEVAGFGGGADGFVRPPGAE